MSYKMLYLPLYCDTVGQQRAGGVDYFVVLYCFLLDTDGRFTNNIYIYIYI